MADPDIIVVDPVGDVVLHFQDIQAQVDQQYRCSRINLLHESPYFDVLFDPNKFSEGQEVESKLKELLGSFDGLASIPSNRLPKIIIRDIGEISATEPLRVWALHAFLNILHGETIDKLEKWKITTSQVLLRAALLVTLADHFAAIGIMRQFIKAKWLVTLHKINVTIETGEKITVMQLRQSLLVSMFQNVHHWVRVQSARLISEGSERWEKDLVVDRSSAWENLSHGIEEELQCRREYILETMSSLPKYFIDLYTGKQQQCKLGYDTSPQCDSFQLGEMIRHFTRKDLLRMQSTLSLEDEQPICTDDIEKVIEKLRQCPSYQLDANHHHCGLRSRLLPLLDILWPMMEIGICLKCWNEDRSKESWVTNPTRGTWHVSDAHQLHSIQDICVRQRKMKAMFTADHRIWTSADPPRRY